MGEVRKRLFGKQHTDKDTIELLYNQMEAFTTHGHEERVL